MWLFSCKFSYIYHNCNQLHSQIRLSVYQSGEDEDEDDDENISSKPPACLECLDLWAVVFGLLGAVFAATNYYGKFVGFETFSVCFQIITSILFMLSPLKNVFCKCDKHESAVKTFMPTNRDG